MSEMVIRVEAAIRLARAAEKTGDEVARAAIMALREPTVDMFDRGIEAMQDMDGESKPANLKHLWPAMIDEALKA